MGVHEDLTRLGWFAEIDTIGLLRKLKVIGSEERMGKFL
jgi:hypothetical protein